MRERQHSVAVADLVVRHEDPLRAVLEVIDRTGLEVAMVCGEQQRLEAVVTDGDVRRFLLKGGDLDAPVRQAANPTFKSVDTEVDRTEALQIMLEGGFNCLPVVDDGKLVNIHTLRMSLIGARCASWALVMAGGRGARMGSHTKAVPKPMLPIGDRPILAHLIQHLVSHGIRRIFLSINYLGQMVEDYFEDGRRFHCQIEYLREQEPLGTGGPLRLLPERPAEPLLVMNGDLLTRINVGRMLAFHENQRAMATMAIREQPIEIPFGVASIEDNLLVDLVEKPSLTYQINAGIYVIDPELISRIPEQGNFPITDLLRGCLDRNERVGAYHMNESWSDIGMPEDLEWDRNAADD